MQHLMQGLMIYYGLLNGLTFFVFGWDKQMARAGRWRVAEKRLYLLGALGGWVGGFLAMTVFKHKRRKASFLWRFVGLAFGHFMIGMSGWFVYVSCFSQDF